MIRRVPVLARTALSGIDVLEFIRFFVTGIVATIGNIGTVWLAGYFIAYRWALLCGLATGFAISFAMGKFFAFRSRSLRHAPSEMARFTLVYVAGAFVYWMVAMAMGLHVLPRFMGDREAGLVGAFLGASTMVVTSYLGHRYFTYGGTRNRVG